MTNLKVPMLCLALAAGAMAAKPPPANPMSGKSLAELTEVLKTDAPEMDRANAALVLAEFVSPPKEEKGKKQPKKASKEPEWELEIPEGFIDACSIGLADPASAVRFYSGHALAMAGTDALPALIKAAASDNDDEKISAIHAVGMMARTMEKTKGTQVDPAAVFGSAVPTLQKALKDENYIVRETACSTFSRLGTAGAPAIEDLIALLEDEHFSVVNQAVHAVAAADPGGTKSVPALVKAIESEHDVREFIAKELGAMGKAAKTAVPALCKLVGEDKNSWQVVLVSAEALVAIISYEGKPAEDAVVAERRLALGALAAALANQDAEFLNARLRNRVLALSGYCPIGAEIEPAMPYFEELLREWVSEEPGYYPQPVGELCEFLARISENHRRDNIAALGKELKAAKDTKEVWVKDLDPILNLDNK